MSENYHYGTYGSASTSYGGFIPVWKYIAPEGLEEAGGTFYVDASSSFAATYPAGTIIPVGTPVSLSEPGGDLTILKTFEADADFDSSTSVKVVLKAAGTALPPVVGEFYMLAPATVGTTGTGYEVKNVSVDASGNYSIDISAGDWGAAAEGAIFVQCDKAGAGAVMFTTPTGLLRREVYIAADVTAATGASVFNGTILGDRIPPVPACVKAVLPQIKFEKG
jgi:hypothetical protein